MTSNGHCNETAIAKETRDAMLAYWTDHSKEASIKEMMLDEEAEVIGQCEIPEVLELLPDFTGKDVVELGAGVGRFTGILAEKAKSVYATDFMQKFVEKNVEDNGQRTNVTIHQSDVTDLELPAESADLVFSNWLLMYLSDEEVRDLFQRELSWLREGGHMFFRESCFHQSGNRARDANPSRYRDPATYNALFQSVSIPDKTGKGSYGYELVLSRSVQAYVKHKSNPNQICWLLEKVSRQTDDNHHGFTTFQQFLDTQQYSRIGILRYERIFGRHFVSTGGKDTTEEFVEMLNLKAGESVLDVGSGIGGSAFYMAEKFDVNVVGIDLSSNMIAIGWESLNEIKDQRVQFEVADATKRAFNSESFEVIYSRDTILHIKDKKLLFQNFLKWLKPGGRLLISDYCCSDGEHTDQFKAYVKQRGYHLHSPAEYGKIIESAGFVNVKAEDRTDTFVSCLHRELAKARSIKDEFIKEFSQSDYDAIINGWEDKLVRTSQGDQRWGLFYAEKPTASLEQRLLEFDPRGRQKNERLLGNVPEIENDSEFHFISEARKLIREMIERE